MGEVLKGEFPDHSDKTEDEQYFEIEVYGVAHSTPAVALQAFVRGDDVPEMVPIARVIVAMWMADQEKLAANYQGETE